MNFGRITKIFKCSVMIVVCSNTLMLMFIVLLLLSTNTDKEKIVIQGKHQQTYTQRDIPSDHNFDIKHFVLLGNLHPMKEVLLNIGIASVWRPGGVSYLHDTLQSALAVSSYEKEKLRIILLLTDANSTVVEHLHEKYGKQLTSGLLVVVGPIPDSYYPSFDDLPKSYDDPPDRITWRSKQNLDYAFLWRLVLQTKAQYFLQLEDDIICTENYFPKLVNFVDAHKNVGSWALMEFSTLGFIGKLLKMEDLNKMASLAYHFYAQQPVDYLLMVFRQIMNQKDPIKCASLFQHIGKQSSLAGKEQPLVDEYFEAKDMGAHNPPATFQTSMISNGYKIPLTNAYNRDQSYFSYDKPKVGDWFVMAFNATQDIRALRIVTGNVARPHDFLHDGRAEWSGGGGGGGPLADCGTFTAAGVFEDGVFAMESRDGVKCMRVTVTGPQDTWLLVRDIAVFVKRPG